MLWGGAWEEPREESVVCGEESVGGAQEGSQGESVLCGEESVLGPMERQA